VHQLHIAFVVLYTSSSSFVFSYGWDEMAGDGLLLRTYV
jgi:hypothetical protein